MKKEYSFVPEGVCSTKMDFVINDDNTIDSLVVTRGCNGNLKGIASLIKGRDIDEVINSLDGIKCGFKDTSCPNEKAKCLKKIKQERKRN